MAKKKIERWNRLDEKIIYPYENRKLKNNWAIIKVELPIALRREAYENSFDKPIGKFSEIFLIF